MFILELIMFPAIVFNEKLKMLKIIHLLSIIN